MLILLLLVVLLAAGSYAYLPTMALKLCRWRRARRRQDGKVLYLTFDDGPDPQYTPALLDLLAQHDIHATFFVVGDAAQAHPHIIQRMQEEGHLIGLHSASHKSAYLLTPSHTRDDFDRGVKTMAGLGVPLLYFRPPWGVVNLASFRSIRYHRLKLALWDVMAQDWRGDITAQEIIRRLRRRCRNGSVICLHDGRGENGAPGRTIQALALLLPQWLEEGFQFQTLEYYEAS